VDGTLTEAEARLEILKERQRVNGRDSATDALIAKVGREIEMSKKPQGRDLYLHQFQRAFGGEPDDSVDYGQFTGHDSSLDGRDLRIRHLEDV